MRGGPVGRYEQPVVVPQVMHPPHRFQHVTSVRNGAILRRLLNSRAPCVTPWTTEHGQNTDSFTRWPEPRGRWAYSCAPPGLAPPEPGAAAS